MRGDGDAVIGARETLRPTAEGGQLRVLLDFGLKGTFGDGVPSATDINKPDLAEVKAERLLAGPPELPPDIVATLSEAINKAKVDPQVEAWAESTGYVKLSPNTPESAAEAIRQQAVFFDKWKPQFQNL